MIPIVTTIPTILVWLIVAAVVFVTLSKSYVTVKQAQVGIITRFGKFRKIAPTGLNFKAPFIDKLMNIVSLQNRTIEVKFQAVTQDQANVFFNAMLLYGVSDSSDETIQKVAFKFHSTEEFTSALLRTVEGEVRAFVATKKQAEVLTLRSEIVDHIKAKLDDTLAEWGFHLQNLQMNDISFDEAIMTSMAQVVASNNLKAAAENEGNALLIKKTKAAEAEGNAIKISADAERIAAQMRGQGIAAFREEVAKGMAIATETMGNGADGMAAMLFSMWIDGMKQIAEVDNGNVMFFDGSVNGLENTMKQIQAMNFMKEQKPKIVDPGSQTNRA